MRYKAGQKAETRRKMLAAASRRFRRHGYSGIGVDGLAKAAGVTSGAFYSHFGSKGAAFEEALGVGLDEVIDGVPWFQREHGADWVGAFAGYYLGLAHRRDLDCGCAMAALTPDVIRGDEAVHQAYEAKMVVIAGLVAEGLAGGSEKDRLARAWAMLSVLIGGVSVARGMNSPGAANEVAASVKAAAALVAGPGRAVAKPA